MARKKKSKKIEEAEPKAESEVLEKVEEPETETLEKVEEPETETFEKVEEPESEEPERAEEPEEEGPKKVKPVEPVEAKITLAQWMRLRKIEHWEYDARFQFARVHKIELAEASKWDELFKPY